MQFNFQINSGNAAFEDEPQIEIARLLRAAADTVENDVMDGVLIDFNGNRVGSFTYNE
jgi:hypothetical protein